MTDKKLHAVRCFTCGKEFYTTLPNRRYCSDLCKRAADKSRRRAWERNNPGYNAEYARRRRQETTEK